MDLDEAIRGRRSVRSYVDKGVSEELVRLVIEAGTFAPSAKNGQQWRFTVMTGEAKRGLTDVFRRELEKLSTRIDRGNMGSSFGSCRIMEEAPVVIMVWNAGEMGWETEAHSAAAAIQNMLLKAYALGLDILANLGNSWQQSHSDGQHIFQSLDPENRLTKLQSFCNEKDDETVSKS
jgi:nitroreductase